MGLSRSLYRRAKNLLQTRALVLMYHRIDNVTFDPWHLAVSPNNFEEQLQVLKRAYSVIPLSQLNSFINSKRIGAKCVCITFDDGYVDNYSFAKPLLEKYNCPATFFIPNEYIGKKQQYWWDELQDIILFPEKLPSSLSLSIYGNPFFFQLENDGKVSKQEWNKQRLWYYEEEPPTHRCALYLKLWERLKPLPYSDIVLTLAKIRDWAKADNLIDANSFPMSVSQLNDLKQHPLIDLGIHTMTHLSLSAHDKVTQEKEMLGNKQYLENLCSREITTIAYPYGDYNTTTLEVVKTLKLAAAVTTEERLVTRKSSPYQLGRFQVKNWDGEEFEKQLNLLLRGY